MMKLAWLFWEIEWDEDEVNTGNGHWVFKSGYPRRAQKVRDGCTTRGGVRRD